MMRVVLLVLGLVCCLSSGAAAERPRALPEGGAPQDSRLRPLKDLNGYFPFEPPADADAWQQRAEAVRRRVLVSQGLWPLPTKTPLAPVLHSKAERPGYTMECVYFQSLPGFYVTGTLYRPRDRQGPHPGVLCPHGHWPQGRFMDRGEAGAKKELAAGAETMMAAARSPLQARCVQLARMGCVVFHYDMIGYADSTQLSFELAHRFAKQREEFNDRDRWGLFSPQAESRLQSVMGLQTWDSIRALDFLAGLPEVDPQRLAVTGASGGGTQTFLLAAVDPRVKVAVPAVMVSTAMQGGCTCENASLLRVGTGNVEIAALFAPKPLGLTAADDWTREMQTKGFPQLQSLYRLLGAEQNVALWSHTQFPHNYNLVTRTPMYVWMKRHLELEGDVQEQPFEFSDRQQLTVWRDGHPRPDGGPELERQLTQWLADDARRQLEQLAPGPESGEAALRSWRNVVGPAVDTLIGRELPEASDLEYEQTGKQEHDTYVEMVGLLRDKPREEVSPVLFLYPKQWNGHVVVWLHEKGKDGLLDKSGRPGPPVAKLLAAGVAVAGVDLLLQGEHLAGRQAPDKTRRVGNPREAAGYTFGYNHSLLARRVHDVLKMVAFVRAHEYQPRRVSLVGWEGEAGVWAAAARAQARSLVDRAVVHTRGFRFAHVDDLHSPQFLPGGAKYHDLPGMLAVAAPAELWLNEENSLVQAAYAAGGGEVSGGKQATLDEALDWLIKSPR